MAVKSARMDRPVSELRTSYRGILLTMIVSFAVSFAFLYWKQESRRMPAPAPPGAAPPVASPIVPAPTIARAPQAPAVARITQKPAPPVETFEGPPLPVMFNVTQQNGEESAGELAGIAEVHIKNSSDGPLAVTVLDENQSTRHTSQAHVLLAPNGETSIGAEDGLNMQSGDQVTVRSSGFSVLTATVP
jgi:hypothetical protein